MSWFHFWANWKSSRTIPFSSAHTCRTRTICWSSLNNWFWTESDGSIISTLLWRSSAESGSSFSWSSKYSLWVALGRFWDSRHHTGRTFGAGDFDFSTLDPAGARVLLIYVSLLLGAVISLYNHLPLNTYLSDIIMRAIGCRAMIDAIKL